MKGGISFTVTLGWVLVWAPFLAPLGCAHQAAPAVSAPPDTGVPSPAVAAELPKADASTDDTSPTSDESPLSALGEEKVAEAKLEELPPQTPHTPQFFEGRQRVTYGEFISELRKIADALVDDADVVAAHRALLAEKNLSEEELPLSSFSRVRLAFESGRDSGLWGIRGTITDQMPWSDRIWEQWSGRTFSPKAPLSTAEAPAFPTAVGECDEMGALFAILARDLEVTGFVGLHWPYWNHVVPIWQVNRKDGSFVRIIVPATQTFLEDTATIGTTGLPTNRVVFPYVRKDRRDATELSGDLVRFLLTQSYLYGGLSTGELTQKRLWHRWNHRPGAAEKEPKKSAPSPGASARLRNETARSQN